MPVLVETNGSRIKRARCPVCKKSFSVREEQVGCCLACPLCHAGFRLFETDLVKPRHLVVHPPRPRHPRFGIQMLIAASLVIFGSVGVLFIVRRGAVTTATLLRSPAPPPLMAKAAPGRVEVHGDESAKGRADVTAENQRVSVARSTIQSNDQEDRQFSAKPPTVTSIVLSVSRVGASSPAILPSQEGERVTDFPWTLYADCVGPAPFTASGYMGNFLEMDFDDCCALNPQSGESCIRIAYNSTHGWVGVAWQDPANNWGDIPGGYNLEGAKRLTFWARGETGMEYARFEMGLIGITKQYADSARITTPKIQLSKDWKKYEMPLQGLDLSRIITGFAVILEGASRPVVIYVDEVQFE